MMIASCCYRRHHHKITSLPILHRPFRVSYFQMGKILRRGRLFVYLFWLFVCCCCYRDYTFRVRSYIHAACSLTPLQWICKRSKCTKSKCKKNTHKHRRTRATNNRKQVQFLILQKIKAKNSRFGFLRHSFAFLFFGRI